MRITGLLIFFAMICSCTNFDKPDTSMSDTRETFHREIAVSPDSEVSIVNVNGFIDVSSWDKDFVDIQAVKKSRFGQSGLDAIKIDIENTGDEIKVKTEHRKFNIEEEESFFLRMLARINVMTGNKGSVDYTVKIPSTTLLKSVKTVNGNVKIRDISGDFLAASTNGNVTMSDVDGVIEANTTNGNINIENSTGIKKAHTVNGSISADLAGDIAHESDLSTVNGSVSINIPSDTNLNLDISTVNGKITSGSTRILVEKMSKKHIVGSVGDGGKLLNVHTVNGSISLN